jgi:uncharacterized membrane protein
LIAWFVSMWPTLLPRTWVVQGVVSGVSAAIGWLLGVGLGHLLHRSLAAIDRPLPPAVRRIAWLVLAVLAPVLVVTGLALWYGWQRNQRRFIGMTELPAWWTVGVVVASAVVLAVLVLIGRAIATFVKWIDRRVERVIPRWWARALITIGIVVVLIVVANVGERRFVRWADRSFGAVNDTTPDGVDRPTSPTRSGSPPSLVPWDTLGYQGQAFTGSGPDAEDIARLDPDASTHGAPLDPIRVYVGLDSADDVPARTDLAMGELDRTHAWDRDVLVVTTATGTGWVNPAAARAIEIMYGGDTAIVSMQYSFLPSWIAFLIDPSGADEAGIALFDAVHARWAQLPADHRPKLIVYGESLGSNGGERAFSDDGRLGPQASLESIVAQTDGALFVGPVATNTIYGRLVDERDPGSPSWRPQMAAVPQLRVANQVAAIAAGDASWTGPRILYLHHPTDAVGTWTPAALWRPPGWTDDPLGYGVPDAVQWFPIVTWVQETADLMAGFSAEPGYGHDYTDAFVAAWAAVAPPAGWTAADTTRVEASVAAAS